MNKKSIVILCEAILAAITYIVITIIAFHHNAVIEGSIGEEIAKWMVMTPAVCLVVGLVAYWPFNVLADVVVSKRENKK